MQQGRAGRRLLNLPPHPTPPLLLLQATAARCLCLRAPSPLQTAPSPTTRACMAGRWPWTAQPPSTQVGGCAVLMGLCCDQSMLVKACWSKHASAVAAQRRLLTAACTSAWVVACPCCREQQLRAFVLLTAACISVSAPAAENSTFVDNNAFVFGDDIYVDDPSGCCTGQQCSRQCQLLCMLCRRCACCAGACSLPPRRRNTHTRPHILILPPRPATPLQAPPAPSSCPTPPWQLYTHLRPARGGCWELVLAARQARVCACMHMCACMHAHV